MDQRSNRSETSMPLLNPSRRYPSEAQRAAAWRAAFADDAGPFRGAFEYAGIGMAIVDLDGRFLKVNRALTLIVGYDEAELLALDFQSITHPDDLEADLMLARQLMLGDIDHFDLEKRYIHKDGHIVWILLSASVARDDSGAACYAISQIQDISARKAAEEETARHLRHVDRLTHAVWSIMQVIASTPGEGMYSSALRTVMKTFDSPAGVFLRFTDSSTLCGPFISPREMRQEHRWPTDRCELWYQALTEGHVLIENSMRKLDCGFVMHRSLAGPIVHGDLPIGLFHMANAARDYDHDDRDLLERVTAIIAPVLHARMERDKLTPREAEVMDLIVSGMSQKQIATTLNISVQTTAKHRARVLDKLQLHSDVDLVHLAIQMRVPWTHGHDPSKMPVAHWLTKQPGKSTSGLPKSQP